MELHSRLFTFSPFRTYLQLVKSVKVELIHTKIQRFNKKQSVINKKY